MILFVVLSVELQIIAKKKQTKSPLSELKAFKDATRVCSRAVKF